MKKGDPKQIYASVTHARPARVPRRGYAGQAGASTGRNAAFSAA